MAFVHSRRSKSLAVIFGLLLASAVVFAQSPTPQSNEQAPRAGVNLNVIITDEANRFATDVRREEVRVTEDGVAQTITAFALEDRPASYGLVIDTTGSVRALLNEVVETGRAIISANRPGDEAFVMHYVDTDTIEVDAGWTSNQAALEESLDDLFVQGGLTATLDALHSALTYATRPRRTNGSDDKGPRRHALVIITDGEDRGSRESNPETLLARLRQTDVQVFVVGLSKLSKEMKNREKAISLLTRLAQESGGRAFFPKSTAELPEVVKELTHDLHTQYALSYQPTNDKRDGSFRKVQVTLAAGKSKRTIVTRAGYNAPQ